MEEGAVTNGVWGGVIRCHKCVLRGVVGSARCSWLVVWPRTLGLCKTWKQIELIGNWCIRDDGKCTKVKWERTSRSSLWQKGVITQFSVSAEHFIKPKGHYRHRTNVPPSKNSFKSLPTFEILRFRHQAWDPLPWSCPRRPMRPRNVQNQWIVWNTWPCKESPS